LKRFGYDVETTNGEKVHYLYNVMTMQHSARDFFDRLNLWFEETVNVLGICLETKLADFVTRVQDTLNYYKVWKTKLYLQAKDHVMFTMPDPVKLPLPSPGLLTFHVACAQVTHLSGAGEYVDNIIEDMEEICMLAHDGT
jgi:hypothetical protein